MKLSIVTSCEDRRCCSVQRIYSMYVLRKQMETTDWSAGMIDLQDSNQCWRGAVSARTMSFVADTDLLDRCITSVDNFGSHWKRRCLMERGDEHNLECATSLLINHLCVWHQTITWQIIDCLFWAYCVRLSRWLITEPSALKRLPAWPEFNSL